jgi:hypothetical protein
MSTGDPTPTPPGLDPGAADPVTASTRPAGAQWPAQAADLVVEVVDAVRDKTTTPVLTIARAVVYGTAIVFLAITSVVLLIVAMIRFIDVWLPGDVWSAYLLLGTLMLVGGLVLWATRRPRTAA